MKNFNHKSSIKIKNIDIRKGQMESAHPGMLPSQFQIKPQSLDHLLSN